ncbi:MAG: helix-turn-helix domain-containing protein [Candidatus Caldarchaeales archaeon]
MVNPKSSEKNIFQFNDVISNISVDLLKVLKANYNYRKLSSLTGIPVSTLTRYLTGRTTPKGSKARKLLRDLILNVNLSSLISQFIRDDGTIDLPRIMFNPNMIKIMGAHAINEFAGMKITSFMSLDLLSMPLTSYLSTTTSRHFYIVSREPLSVDDGGFFILSQNKSRYVWPDSYWIFFNKVKKKEEVLMISSIIPEEEFFNKLVRVLEEKGVEIAGLFSVLGSEERLLKLDLKPGCKKSFLLQE